MQFQYNADYPQGTDAEQRAKLDARGPLDFPPAQPISCTRITTRVYHPTTQSTTTVQNVLVRTAAAPTSRRHSQHHPSRRQSAASSGSQAVLVTSPIRTTSTSVMDDDDVVFSSSDSDFSSSDEEDYAMTDSAASTLPASNTGATPSVATSNIPTLDDEKDECAYWIQRTVREAIYGRVLLAIVLKKTKRPPSRLTGSAPTAVATEYTWEVTPHLCAVKEMSWQHIRKERNRLAENPIQEVNAMQYLHSYCDRTTSSRLRTTHTSPIEHAFANMIATNVMMPLDILSDEHFLYSIMPYCNGGELFEWLDQQEKFTENQARYWMNQILNGLECLQHAGICHRDMSLENLLVHESGALIIDMGMCLRVPVEAPAQPFLQPVVDAAVSEWATSFGHLNLSREHNDTNHAAVTASAAAIPFHSSPTGLPNGTVPATPTTVVSARQQLRFLIQPQGTCGKWIYMSPEIYKNSTPFDGFAVDMWAAGVILFLMVTGFPPWDRACSTDERFRYMSAGYLVQMLTEWELGLSPDVMDLLQRMLFVDPKDRLSLDQVRAHPWMINGPCEPPSASAGGR